MLTVDLSLPCAAVLVLAAGFAGWWTRGEARREFSDDIDRTTPDIRAFEKRNQRTI